MKTFSGVYTLIVLIINFQPLIKICSGFIRICVFCKVEKSNLNCTSNERVRIPGLQQLRKFCFKVSKSLYILRSTCNLEVRFIYIKYGIFYLNFRVLF